MTTMTPDDVIQVILDSGLRGRGGAGFDGVEMEIAKGNQAEQKYVCCNADEGDPGAFMDRSVLEGDPHVVLEGNDNCEGNGNRGVTSTSMCVRNIRSQLNVWKSQFVRRENTECLAKIFFGSGFDFDIDLRLGAGAFVCGEETALMTSIEGNRGEPRPRPPFPALKGLFQKTDDF